MNDFVKEMLNTNYEARIREVEEYEFNNENYLLALEEIGDDPDLQEFKQQLIDLLKASTIETKKAKTMLKVLEKRLGG